MKKIFLAFLILIQLTSSSQNSADSLHKVLANVSGENELKVYLELAHLYALSSFDSAEYYVNQVLSKAKQSHNKEAEAKALKIYGNINIRQGNLNEAESYYLKSIKIFKSINAATEIAKIYNNLGMLYIYTGDNLLAIKNLESALSYYKQNNEELLQTGPLINIGQIHYRSGKYQLALEHFTQAFQIAEAFDQKDILVNVSNNLGAVNEILANYTQALQHYNQAINYAKDLNDEYVLAVSLNNIGIVYEELGNLNTAIDYFLKSLEITRRIEAQIKTTKSLIKIGDVYLNWQKHQIALDYYFEALNTSKITDDKLSLGQALVGIANTYSELSIYNKTLDYLNEAVLVFESSGNTRELAETYCLMGNVYADNFENYRKAEGYYKMSQEILEEIQAPAVLGSLYLSLSKNYYQQKKYQKCISFAHKSLKLKEHNPLHIYEVNLLLAEAYQQSHNLNASLKYYKQALAIKDTINHIEFQKHTAALITEHELNKKEQEISELKLQTEIIGGDYLKKKKARNMYLAATVLALLALAVLAFLYNKLKISNQKLMEHKVEIEEHQVKLEESNIQLKKAKREAEQLSQFKNQFLANISHEIRTPLNAISGYAKLMRNNLVKESNQIHINNVIQSSENLMVIINDLVDFSKIEAGKMVIDQVPFSPLDIITQTLSTLKFRAEEKNIKFEIHIDPMVPTSLLGDPYRLSQILTNLITNAIKFSNNDQLISIEAQGEIIDKKCHMQFLVKDNGIGISENKLETIFESFTQVSSDTSRQSFGTGLGLAIVKRLIELQQGEITVKSQVGIGSTFIVKIPYEIQIAEENKSDESAIKETSENKIYTILLVEDNEINQELAKDTIESWNENFKIEIAENGKEALEFLQKNTADVILMDIQMPVMDGHEATQYIRESLPEPKCNIPIIGMTAHAMTCEKELGLKNGMNEYIIKPFNPDELKQKIVYFVKQNR